MGQKRPTRWRCGRGSVVVRCFSEKRLNGDARFGLGDRVVFLDRVAYCPLQYALRSPTMNRVEMESSLSCTEVADHESSGDGILPFFLLLRAYVAAAARRRHGRGGGAAGRRGGGVAGRRGGGAAGRRACRRAKPFSATSARAFSAGAAPSIAPSGAAASPARRWACSGQSR